jgi:hypothetical protein
MIVQGVTLNGTTVADSYITTQNLAIWIDASNSHNITGSDTSPAGTQAFGYVVNMFLYTSKLTQLQIQQNYGALKGVFGV